MKKIGQTCDYGIYKRYYKNKPTLLLLSEHQKRTWDTLFTAYKCDISHIIVIHAFVRPLLFTFMIIYVLHSITVIFPWGPEGSMGNPECMGGKRKLLGSILLLIHSIHLGGVSKMSRKRTFYKEYLFNPKI